MQVGDSQAVRGLERIAEVPRSTVACGVPRQPANLLALALCAVLASACGKSSGSSPPADAASEGGQPGLDAGAEDGAVDASLDASVDATGEGGSTADASSEASADAAADGATVEGGSDAALDADAAGPADGGDAAVHCTSRGRAMCRAREPDCPEGEVPRVIAGCWGECVPIGECECEEPDHCPHREKFTCVNSSGRCSYYL